MGVLFNMANLALVGFLVLRDPRGRVRIVKGSLAAYAIGEDTSLPRAGAGLDSTP